MLTFAISNLARHREISGDGERRGQRLAASRAISRWLKYTVPFGGIPFDISAYASIGASAR